MKIAKNLDAILRVYYTCPEIGNEEICEIYGATAQSTISKMKRIARKLQTEEGVRTIGLNTVNTKTAYKAWGIDVKAVEENRAKLKKLGLYEPQEVS